MLPTLYSYLPFVSWLIFHVPCFLNILVCCSSNLSLIFVCRLPHLEVVFSNVPYFFLYLPVPAHYSRFVGPVPFPSFHYCCLSFPVVNFDDGFATDSSYLGVPMNAVDPQVFPGCRFLVFVRSPASYTTTARVHQHRNFGLHLQKVGRVRFHYPFVVCRHTLD